MKQLLYKIFIAYCFLSINIQNLAHGFDPNTCVRNDENSFWQIEQICRFVRENEKQFVLSYDFNSKLYVNSKVLSAGESITNCYFRFGFDENKYDKIICTPSQEFYNASAKRWIPCYQLKVGNDLLCLNRVKKIAHIKFFKESLKVYSISIKATNNFFVGKYSVLTHNMTLPLISFGLTASFGSGAAAGGATGGYFGPVTFAIGGIAGGLIGAAYYLFSDKKVPQYDLKFDIKKVNNYNIDLQFDPTWSEDAKIVISENKKINSSIQKSNLQFLEIPTKHPTKNHIVVCPEAGKVGNIIYQATKAPGQPTKNDGFEPPKNWDGEKRRTDGGQYGYPDNKGRIWVPQGENAHRGPHWDVECPDGNYDNVMPGGKVFPGRKK